MDGSIQIRYGTDLTVEDYITRKAWWDASPPPCRFHPQGGCRLVPHGTYARKSPDGVRVRRFRCPRTGRTVSLLPDCLAAHHSGTLAEFERAAREAEQAGRREAAANTLRTDAIELAGAVRWVTHRARLVQLVLTLLRTLRPDRFGSLEPSLDAFGTALGSELVLVRLRGVGEAQLAALPAPLGFRRERIPAGIPARPRLQQATGLDPPPQAA